MPSQARTRNQYVVDAGKLVMAKEVELAPTIAIAEKLVPLVDRSTQKPVSFVALSVHARLIRLDDTAVAVRFDGAAGAGVGLAVDVGVGLGVGAGVALPVGAGVGLPIGVGDGLAVGVGVGVGDGVGLGVLVGVGVGATVGVGEGVGPGVPLPVGAGVGLGVAAPVGVGVGVTVGVGDGVGAGVGVALPPTRGAPMSGHVPWESGRPATYRRIFNASVAATWPLQSTSP